MDNSERKISRSDGKAKRDRLKLALYVAINDLGEADGRVQGLKFNKLMYKMFKKFEGTPFHFDLPYRWYLYGVATEHLALRPMASFDHEDEFTTNVTWHGKPPL